MNLNLRKWGTLIILSVIWGSSYILIKKGLTGLTPVQLGSVRVIITTLLIAPIGYNKIKHIPKRKMKWVALSAFVGSFFPAYLFAFAETEISSSVTAVMVSLTPLFTLLISVIVGVCLRLTKRDVEKRWGIGAPSNRTQECLRSWWKKWV